MRIFSSFINAGREFILAHNQFVSIFNLTRERWTERHHEFGDAVRQVFRNRTIRSEESSAASLEKKNRNGDAEEGQFDVGVLVSESTFHFFELGELGRVIPLTMDT